MLTLISLKLGSHCFITGEINPTVFSPNDIISIAVIKNNLDKISRNARLSCPGFIEPMTSVLHHSCHDRIVRIGAIELRKKPVLPALPGYGTQLHSVLEDKTQL